MNPHTKLGRPTWPHAQAFAVALEIQHALQPSCHRILIAGSIRRNIAQVHDIELLCIPNAEPQPPRDMFGNVLRGTDMLSTTLTGFIDDHYLASRGGFGPLNKMLTHTASGIPIDVFSTTEANWGMSLVVRTGPALFNVSIMAHLRRLGMRGHAYGGITLPSGAEAPCPTERDVFTYVGWPYIPPRKETMNYRDAQDPWCWIATIAAFIVLGTALAIIQRIA